MIRILIKGAPDHIEGFLIWGHARYARYGKDVVCASVSAVATTALIGLAELAPGSARYGLSPQGLIWCGLSPEQAKADGREAQTILKTMVLGLEAIRRGHRAYIDLTYRR